MIKLEITAIDATDLHIQLRALLGGSALATTLAVTGEGGAGAPLAEPAKRGRPPKAEPVSQATDQSENQDSTLESGTQSLSTTGQTATSAASPSDAPLTYNDHVKPAILKVSAHPEDRGGGRSGVERLVKQFGGETEHGVNAKFIPVANWPDLLAAVDALLEAA